MKNFFNRVFTKVKQKSVQIIGAPFQWSGMENFFDSLNLRTYKESLYLFIGVSMIRDTASSIPLEMYRIKNADGDVEEINDDPMLDLIERPNERQTKMEFWKLAVAYYLLAGETFWYFERATPGAKPTAKANMRPDHVEILFSEDRKSIVGYNYTQNNGEIIRIAPEDVLHIKNIDPTDPTRGVGVIRPASQRIVTEKEASEHQSYTFKNQGRPDIAVFTDNDLNDEDAEDARERWKKIYGGTGGSSVGFFGNQVKELKQLNITPKEMDFIKTQNFLRDDILAALRIPKAMVTSDDVNLANAQTARIIYVKEACLPVLDVFIDVINNKLLADQDEDKFIAYESPVNEDREMILKEATELKKNGIISQNEARALMNYPEVEGGDTFDEPGGMFQLAMKRMRLRKMAKQLLKKRPVLIKKFKAIEAVTKVFEEQRRMKKSMTDPKRARNSVFHTQELKEGYIKAFNANIDAKARGFKDTLDVYNNGLMQRIITQMEELGVNPQNIFDPVVEIPKAKDIFVPMMKSMYERIGNETMDQIANGFAQGKASEGFYTLNEVLQALELRAEFFISSMLDTDFKEMNKIIAAGLADGKGVDQIARDIRKYFDDMSVSRAKTIARTETGRLVSQATNDAYIQSDVVTGKEWLTSRDAKVRNNAGTINDHVINDGVIVEKGGTFPNGEQYPGQYTINCRCALAPAV